VRGDEKALVRAVAVTETIGGAAMSKELERVARAICLARIRLILIDKKTGLEL
jgi:hypothetical protein